MPTRDELFQIFGPEYTLRAEDYQRVEQMLRPRVSTPPQMPLPPQANVNNFSEIETRFIDACKLGDSNAVEDFLKVSSPLGKDTLSTGLSCALEGDHISIARHLLLSGTKIAPGTALKTRSFEGFQVMTDSGWDVMDAMSWIGTLGSQKTIFETIVSSNNIPLLNWFLSHGGDAMLKDPRWPGYLLDQAAELSSPQVIDVILSHGALLSDSLALHRAVLSGGVDLHLNLQTLSPLTRAQMRLVMTERTTAQRVSMIEHLIHRGADVNKVADIGTPYGGSPLHAACAQGKVEEAKCLLEHGADMGCKNKAGMVPFDMRDVNDNQESWKKLSELFENWKGGPGE